MTIDLTPNNQQIKPENMAKYPDHKEWPYESLRTITEMISPSKAIDMDCPTATYMEVYAGELVVNKEITHGKYGNPIEQNIEIYKRDLAMGLTADIADADFEFFMPKFYITEGRASKNAVEIYAICHSKENQEFVEKLLAENKIKVPPQYQYYRDSPGSLDIRLKFETKEDADAWKIAKMKET